MKKSKEAEIRALKRAINKNMRETKAMLKRLKQLI